MLNYKATIEFYPWYTKAQAVNSIVEALFQWMTKLIS